MPNLTAIEERFDAQAAQALEDLIEHVESENPVKVTGLTVDLVPDNTDNPSSPGVEVNLTVERGVSPALNDRTRAQRRIVRAVAALATRRKPSS